MRSQYRCINCRKEVEIHAFGKCSRCYRRTYKQPIIICKVCGKQKEHHSRNMCKNCVQKEFYYDQIKGYNVKKYHNIDYNLWKKVTQKCSLCDFDKVVELHHLDMNHGNNS